MQDRGCLITFLLLFFCSFLFVVFLYSVTQLSDTDGLGEQLAQKWTEMKEVHEAHRKAAREKKKQEAEQVRLAEHQETVEEQTSQAVDTMMNAALAEQKTAEAETLKQRFDSLCQKVRHRNQRLMVSKPRVVDLGLSVLWADRNLGAKGPDEAGYLFNRMGTRVMDAKDCREIDEAILAQPFLGSTPFDAAHMSLEHGWRLPTEAEMRELTTLQWQDNGNGLVFVVGANSSQLCIPLTGFMVLGDELKKKGHATMFWLAENTPNNVFYIHLGNGMVMPQHRDHNIAIPIRPVKDR